MGHWTKKKNNGALILVALDNRKVTIQIGYGLEGAITDALAKRIIENEIKPNFKSGNYFQGLDQATTILMSLAKGEFSADNYLKKNRREQNAPLGVWLIIIIVFAFIFLRSFSSANNYSRTNNVPFWTALLLMNMGSSIGRGSWSNFSSGSGSFGGGSSFGGFGGGSFGGGGASGSW